MSEHRGMRFGLAICALGALLTGCQSPGNPFAMRNQNLMLKRSLAQLQDRNAEMQSRVGSLDTDNQQLQGILAQERQRNGQLQQEVDSLYAQLAEAQRRATYAPPASAGSGSRSAFNGGTASASWLPIVQVSGAEVVRDGEVVRIRMTNTNLFDPGSATLKSGARQILDRVAGAIRENYAGLKVGVEGHTDADPIRKSKWKDNHDLSVQRAMAVYEYLRKTGGISGRQLFVAGHGPNEPLAPNNSASGKAQNRRVELVVYPQRVAQR